MRYRKPKIIQRVHCISERFNFPKAPKLYQDYILDLESVYMDSDGDAYGHIYTLDMDFVGNMLLKHFSTNMI